MERSIVKAFRGTRLLLCLLSKYLGVSYGDVVAMALDACGGGVSRGGGGGGYVKILLPSHLASAVRRAAEARGATYASFFDSLVQCFAERLAVEDPRFAEALRRFREAPEKICEALSRV